MIRTAIVIACFSFFGSLKAQEPSDFHPFTGKSGTTIEARVLSISEDRSTLELEDRGGRKFESKITGLTLDDQQFVQRWVKGEPDPETVVKGRLRAVGVLADGTEIDAGAAAEFDDFVAVVALKHGWVGLRENGETVSYSGQIHGVSDVKWLGATPPWMSYVKNDGTVWGGNNRQMLPDSLKGAVQSAKRAQRARRAGLIEVGHLENDRLEVMHLGRNRGR